MAEMPGPVVASFALNSTGLGHASRLVAVHDVLRREHGVASVFLTEHRITLIDEYGFEQVVLPPYEGSLLGDTWWNRDEGTPATVADPAGLTRTILRAVLGGKAAGRTGAVLHDVVLHDQLYRLALELSWPQAFIHRPRADVTEPAAWLAGRAPGVDTMYLVGASEDAPQEPHDGVEVLPVPNVRRGPLGDKGVWGEDDTGIRVAVSAGGGGHADAAAFVHAAVEGVARFAATAGGPVSAFVVPGPFYGGQVHVPAGSAARFHVQYYLPPTYTLHKGTDVRVCQGGYNTVQELARDGVRAVVVPGRRMIDDQARRAQELAAAAPNIRVAAGDPETIAARLAELVTTDPRPSPTPDRNGADVIAAHLAGLLAGVSTEEDS